VTVADLCPEMLRIDLREAQRRGFAVRTIEGSMDRLEMLADESFDLVYQPVSTCYVEDLREVYREVARVLRDLGLYVGQHKQPTCQQVTERDSRDRYVIGVEYYHRGPLPEIDDDSYREPGATEFLHRWEDLVGGLCRAGFVLEDLAEPVRGDPKSPVSHFGHRGMFVPPFVRLKARRLPRASQAPPERRLWTP
jgi:SAM-dependent methyltransferase